MSGLPLDLEIVWAGIDPDILMFANTLASMGAELPLATIQYGEDQFTNHANVFDLGADDIAANDTDELSVTRTVEAVSSFLADQSAPTLVILGDCDHENFDQCRKLWENNPKTFFVDLMGSIDFTDNHVGLDVGNVVGAMLASAHMAQFFQQS